MRVWMVCVVALCLACPAAVTAAETPVVEGSVSGDYGVLQACLKEAEKAWGSAKVYVDVGATDPGDLVFAYLPWRNVFVSASDVGVDVEPGYLGGVRVVAIVGPYDLSKRFKVELPAVVDDLADARLYVVYGDCVCRFGCSVTPPYTQIIVHSAGGGSGEASGGEGSVYVEYRAGIEGRGGSSDLVYDFEVAGEGGVKDVLYDVYGDGAVVKVVGSIPLVFSYDIGHRVVNVERWSPRGSVGGNVSGVWSESEGETSGFGAVLRWKGGVEPLFVIYVPPRNDPLARRIADVVLAYQVGDVKRAEELARGCSGRVVFWCPWKGGSSGGQGGGSGGGGGGPLSLLRELPAVVVLPLVRRRGG